MKVVTEAKTKEEALAKALNDLNLKEEEILYTEENIKGKLFKSGTIKIYAYPKTEILESIKKFILELVNNMGLEVSFETSIREDQFNIKMFSNNNSILIGKNGKTMKAIEMIAKQKIKTKYGLRVRIFLDVENYNEKRIKQLEKLAIFTAKEVVKSKMEVVLDNMNSYERRIIHNALSEFKGISTKSTGEEPNRHIVISYIGEK